MRSLTARVPISDLRFIGVDGDGHGETPAQALEEVPERADVALGDGAIDRDRGCVRQGGKRADAHEQLIAQALDFVLSDDFSEF